MCLHKIWRRRGFSLCGIVWGQGGVECGSSTTQHRKVCPSAGVSKLLLHIAHIPRVILPPVEGHYFRGEAGMLCLQASTPRFLSRRLADRVKHFLSVQQRGFCWWKSCQRATASAMARDESERWCPWLLVSRKAIVLGLRGSQIQWLRCLIQALVWVSINSLTTIMQPFLLILHKKK